MENKCNDTLLLLAANCFYGNLWGSLAHWQMHLRGREQKLEFGRLSLEREIPRQGSPRGNVGNQEGLAEASTGAPHLALHPYPSSAPPVTSNSVPVQKVASEARNTAAAPTSAGWPMRPRGWGDKGKRRSRAALTRLLHTIPLTPYLSDPAPTPTWAIVPSRIVALGSGVEAASSSHRGVQMFPGAMLGGWRRENGMGLLQTPCLGLTPSLPSPPRRLSAHFELLTS